MSSAWAPSPKPHPARPAHRTADLPPQGEPDGPVSPASTGRVCLDVVSGSAITRLGIRALLREFADQVTFTARPHDVASVALLDATTAGASQLLERLHQQGPPVVLLTGDTTSTSTRQVALLGVRACVSREIDGPALLGVLQDAAKVPEPEEPLSPSGGAYTVSAAPGVGGTDLASPGANLTPRQWQAIALVATGSSNAEIARALFITTHSVKTHVSSAYRKIGVRSRSQAILWFAGLRAGSDRPTGDVGPDLDRGWSSGDQAPAPAPTPLRDLNPPDQAS